MNWYWWVVVVALLLLFGLWLSQMAGRLDRLHLRIESARNALELHLARRSGVVSEIAGSGLLDPASSVVLGESAVAAREVDPDDLNAVSIVESELTHALAAIFAERDDVDELDAEAGIVMSEVLEAACRKVQLARLFHNDAVRACLAIRQRRLVTLFRLAGHTPLPRSIELDDSLPPGFATR